MSVTRIVVFGHSHVWSMRRAISGLKSAPGTPEILAPLCGTKEMPGPIVYHDFKGKIQLTSTISALLAKWSDHPEADTTWLLSMVQGNYYNQLGMVATDGAFDTVLPFAPDLPLDEDAELIPYAALRDMLLDQMAEMKSYVRLMSKGAFSHRTILAGTPPPVLDDTPIRTLLSKEAVEDPPSAPHVRLKLWLLQNALMEEMCDGTPLVYIPGTPTDTQDKTGFLRSEYVKDAVHANGEWSSLYLSKITSHLASLEVNRNV